MTKKKNLDLRLILQPEDPLYEIFKDLKNSSGLKKNSEVLRFLLKQLSKIPPDYFFEKVLS